MKKSLLVTLDYPPAVGGVAAYWARVTTSMPADRCVVLAGPQLLSRFVWPRWLRLINKMWRVCRAQGCEIVIAGQVLPVGTAAYVLWRLTGIPYIVQVYGMDVALAKQSGRKRTLARKVLRNARYVIANSQATARQVADFGVEQAMIKVIYPIPEVGAASAEIAEALRKRHHLDAKKIVLTVGRLVARKGHDQVIAAMPVVLEEVRDVVYVVVGDGPERAKLEASAKSLGVRVVFTGRVSDDEKFAWLSLCDVFVMPSRQTPDDVEGFGMVYLEAGAFSKPVIAGNTGGMTEAVEDSKTGLLVDADSVEAIAQAIKNILTDEVLARTLGMAGKRDMESKWSWKKEMDKLKQCLV